MGLDNFSICNCMLRLCYARKNKYLKRSCISEAKFRTIMRYFTQDLPASKLAALSDVSRPTINQRFFKLRPRIVQLCDASSPFSGEVEGDESSFGARRVRGKKGRGGGGKTIVFGILERQGKSTRRSSRMPPRSRYRPRFGASRSVAIFRATRNGVRPISGANNGATAIAFGGPRSSRRALRAAPGLPQ